jgi:serine protease Do
VVTNDGKQYDVTEIARDDANDIAILKIDAKDLTVLPLGDSDSLMVGQDVVAIGTPLGEYSGSVTKGTISGLDRTVAASSSWYGGTSKTYEGVVQTDAAVNPGNSGGPLLNSQGEVIGVNFATTSGADNISFALPINVVKEKIEEYRTYGKFIKPYLGVSYQMISEFEAYYYANVVAGAFIQSIDTNGPAYAAGLRKGDIITKLGEDDVDTSLSTLIQKHDVGERLEVKYYRNGSEKSTTVTLAEA